MKISIVTISYNQRQFLQQAIKSIFAQSHPDVQYIIIDGDSSDGSKQILEQAAQRGVTVISEPDDGPADALNKGFSLAEGDIYGFINSDDLLYPNCTARISEVFNKRQNIDIVSGHADVIDEVGRFRRRVYSDRFSVRAYAFGACAIAQQATFFTAEIFHRAGGFNTSNRIAWDGELWIRMAECGATFGLINETLAAFRVWPGTISSNMHHGDEFACYRAQVFRRLMGRNWRATDKISRLAYRALRHAKNPRSIYERLVHGSVIPHVQK